MTRPIKTTEEDLQRVVREAIHAAFKDVGIIAHNDEFVEKRRRDFEFLHDLRVSAESAKGKVATGFLVLAVGGIAAWLVTGFKFWARQ